MNTPTYKGYIGSVSFSEKDNVFFEKIEGINGLVNFEGESFKGLVEAFHGAVDDYLAYCMEEGNAGGLYGEARPENFPNVNIYRNWQKMVLSLLYLILTN